MLYSRCGVTATPAHFSFAAILSPRSRHALPIWWLVQDSGEPVMVASPGTAAGAFFLGPSLIGLGCTEARQRLIPQLDPPEALSRRIARLMTPQAQWSQNRWASRLEHPRPPTALMLGAHQEATLSK